MTRYLKAILFVVALVVAACAESGSVQTEARGELADCENEADFDWDELPVNGVNLTFDSPEYQAGDLATFRWEVDDGITAIVGDEWIVDCSGLSGTRIAWQTNGVFRDSPTSIVTDVPLGTEDDGWDLVPGSVPIPSSAPVGFYTVTAEGVSFGADGESLGASEFTASFLIVN